MSRYRVVFSQEALEQLEELYDFISDAGSPHNAADYTESIVSFCESLADFPLQGTARDDLRPGLRIIGYRKRVVIAFAIVTDAVAIVGILYGGRDYEHILATE
ncbi:hypothetical protein BH09ACT1_BH09ACT1_17940 [soil metagenome]